MVPVLRCGHSSESEPERIDGPAIVEVVKRRLQDLVALLEVVPISFHL